MSLATLAHPPALSRLFHPWVQPVLPHQPAPADPSHLPVPVTLSRPSALLVPGALAYLLHLRDPVLLLVPGGPPDRGGLPALDRHMPGRAGFQLNKVDGPSFPAHSRFRQNRSGKQTSKPPKLARSKF